MRAMSLLGDPGEMNARLAFDADVSDSAAGPSARVPADAGAVESPLLPQALKPRRPTNITRVIRFLRGDFIVVSS
jgi:hypothetical protein